MGKKNTQLLDAALEESDSTPLNPNEDSSEDEREDPINTAHRMTRRIGQLADMVENPRRIGALIHNDSYQNMDWRSEDEQDELGRRTINAVRNSASISGAGQLLGQVSNIPGVSSIPSAINAGHTESISIRLNKIAKDFVPHNEVELKLQQTIFNCAVKKSGKSTGQFVAIVASVGISVVTTAGLIAITGGAAIVPIAVFAGAAGTSGGIASKMGVTKAFDLTSEFNMEQSITTLIDNAIQDGDNLPAKEVAQAALGALGLKLTDLNNISSTPENSEETPVRKRLNEKVRGLLK